MLFDMDTEKKWNKFIFLLLVPVLAFMLLLFIYPFIYGVYLSFTNQSGGFTLSNYWSFFTDKWDSRTIGITLKIALPATLINVVLAVPFAYYMRNGLKHEKIITFFLIVPITLGTVLISQGMLTFMGPKGWINQLLMFLHIIKNPLRLTHNMFGVEMSLILSGFPFAFLMLLGYTSGINPDLASAAQMLGASKTTIFWKVMFPLMAPGIAIAFCLNFVMAFSVYPSAILLGAPSGPTRVIAISAWEWAFEKFNYNMGCTVSIVMAAIEIAVVAVVLLWRNKMYKGASIVGKG